MAEYKYRGVGVWHDESGEVMVSVSATREGEFPTWVENDPNLDIGYIDGLWRAFLVGEAKEKYLDEIKAEDETESQSHNIYPCMCGGAAGAVCEYCGGLAGVKL
jgi:hypothetical protein